MTPRSASWGTVRHPINSLSSILFHRQRGPHPATILSGSLQEMGLEGHCILGYPDKEFEPPTLRWSGGTRARPTVRVQSDRQDRPVRYLPFRRRPRSLSTPGIRGILSGEDEIDQLLSSDKSDAFFLQQIIDPDHLERHISAGPFSPANKTNLL